MMKQQTLTGFERYAKTTRRAQFLADMHVIVPWGELTAVVEPVYPKSGVIKRTADRRPRSAPGHPGRRTLPTNVTGGAAHDETVKATNRRKSSVRAKVEHVFGVIKRVFGFQQVCYRGLAKNLHRLEVTAAARESLPGAQEIAQCVGNVSAKVAELGIARRKAKTFPRKGAIAPTENEFPLP
jgi:Transposase DDE domain